MRRFRRPAALAATALFVAATLGAHPGGGRVAGEASGSEAWTALSPSPEARTEVAAAALGSSIYVVGGYGSGGTPSTATARYDSETDEWSLVRPLPASVNHAAAVSYRGAFYVVGGYTGAPFSLGIGTGGVADATAAFWRYDPGRDTWTAMPPAPSERGAAAAAVIGDELFVAGGAGALQPLRTLEIFDFRTGSWQRGRDLPLATEHAAGTAAGGSFYVLGGRPFYGGGTHRYLQRYDPLLERWTRAADLTTGHAGFAAMTVCGRVVALGGEDPGSSPTGTVARAEIYDSTRDRWERLPDMRTPRHGFGGAAVGEQIFALEGGPVTLLSVSNVSEALSVECASGGGSGEGGESPEGSRDTPPSKERVDRRGPRRPASVNAPASPMGGAPEESSPADAFQPRVGTAPVPSTGLELAPLLIVGAVLLGLGSAVLVATSGTTRRSRRRSSR